MASGMDVIRDRARDALVVKQGQWELQPHLDGVDTRVGTGGDEHLHAVSRRRDCALERDLHALSCASFVGDHPDAGGEPCRLLPMRLPWHSTSKICSADAPVELPSKKFPIGCEILDCCPGCPGPGPLEVRLDFAAPTGSETRLSVGGVPKAALKTLKLGGNAKMGRRRNARASRPANPSIQGWPSDAKQVPVFTPQVRFADTAIKQLATAGSKAADRPLESDRKRSR